MSGGLELNKKKMGPISSLSKLSGIKSKTSSTAPNTEKITKPTEASSQQANEITTTDDTAQQAERINTTSQKKEPESTKSSNEPQPTPPKSKKSQKKKKPPKLVAINIKITKDQKDWLADTAFAVRENNLEPVAPIDRVYPQHLIGVAIDLLEAAEVDWDQIKSIEELRKHLNL